MKNLLLTLFFVMMLVAIAYNANATVGKVVGVSDGDTIKVIMAGVQTKIRLYGVDCPEKKQAFGQAAKAFTSSMVAGKDVDVEPVAIDRYGRTVALVTVDGASLQEALVVAGMAWVYPQYCKKDFCPGWAVKQQAAEQGEVGLWADPHPQAPWLFRKGKREAAGE